MKIIAHRGASSDAPENTLAAFQKAIDHGADSIELDVRLTKDGVPVICHDATIKRTSDGTAAIHEANLSELKQCDFGSWFDPSFAGEEIPTLDETLRLVKDTDMDLNIEVKNSPIIHVGIEQKMIDLVHKYGMQDRVLFSSFDHQCLKRIHLLDARVKIGFILHMNLVHLFDYIKNSGIEAYSIHPHHFYTTKGMVSEAHACGIKVYPYTIDDMELAEQYLAKGVDGVITNKPLLFKSSSGFSLI
ncbi:MULTISPECIES: glycerophosphodiester phosphodiesterase [Gracilibacillus]|uniref:glycerophosphodiester phosphodiesterase n=1 Tax=Gracilibacillus TaxID=74385 RepID=UPI0008250DA6|nr:MULTISPECIES: glycerophosphodiester phosphodiesterase [Gracilibacillus]